MTFTSLFGAHNISSRLPPRRSQVDLLSTCSRITGALEIEGCKLLCNANVKLAELETTIEPSHWLVDEERFMRAIRKVTEL